MTMPKEEMNWIPSQRRWSRMHKGKRYYISPRQLGCPETKEDSIHAANRWWRKKVAEIDSVPPQAPQERILLNLIGRPNDKLTDADVADIKDAIGSSLTSRPAIVVKAVSTLLEYLLHP